jgi:hypothetical protein
LVDGLAADAELSGQGGFRFTSPSAGSQPVNLIGGEGFAAAAVCPALFGECDPFSLPLFDQCAFDYLDNLPSSTG